MWLIVGLGNPGHKYSRTRHNAGFMVIDALAQEAGAVRWSAKCQSLVCPAKIAGHEVLLIKPLTFMNLSGRAVKLLLAELQSATTDLLVISDDFNLPFGKIRLRERGSAGGHNGLRSVLEQLQTDEVLRLRVGIGEENTTQDQADFVLSEFPRHRQSDLQELIIRAADAVKTILSDGVSRAMAVYNAKQ